MSEALPLISVVIPCFNSELTLRETLESVLAQSWPNLEIIAVDDSSTDNTHAMLRGYAIRDKRVRVVRQANAGCGAARNAGIRQARGQFIGLIDADDLWAPGYLAAHMQRFAADRALGVSFTRVRFIENDGLPTTETTRPKLKGIRPEDILQDNPCGCAMMVARRKVFVDVGLFNDKLRRAEDQEWLFRVALTAWKIEGIDRVMADYRNSPAGLSADLEAQFKAYLELLEHVRQLAPEVVGRFQRLAIAHMLHYMARRAIRLGQDRSVVRGFLMRALKAAPELVLRKPRATFGMLAVALVPGAAEVLVPAVRRVQT